MKKLLLFTFSLLTVLGAFSQINYGGQPDSWDIKDLSAFDIPFYTTDGYDLEKLQAEDAVTDQYKETPYRFGVDHQVDIDFFEQASAVHNADGSTTYRMGFHCPEATSISFLIDDFFIPLGGELYMWNQDRTEFKGAFTYESNKESGIFPIGLLHDDHVILEYKRAAGMSGQASIHISEIGHGYRRILDKWEDQRGPFGNSGACNVNVACPEGDPYEDQISSVALIVQGSSAVCSGAMIGNVNGDDTPYFLTADHCFTNNNTPTTWKFYFNHQSSGCTGSSGPVNNSITGSTVKATNGGSDMALLELSQAPLEDWEIYYNGWTSSTSNNAATSAYGVHHPSGDVKKICFEEDNPSFTTTSGVAVWYIDDWELGVTEGGSSGSPLFNEDGLIVGQLFGGQAACSGNVNNGQWDVYGRFGVSFPVIDQYLDPDGVNPVINQGYYPGVNSLSENDISSQISLYPNPTSDVINIEVLSEGFYNVRVLDLSGKTVHADGMNITGTVALTVDHLESGVYLLEIRNEDYIGTKRFTVN